MVNLVNIVLSPIAPLTTSLNLSLPSDTALSTLPQHIATRLPFPNLAASALLIRHQGRLLHPTSTSLASLQNAPLDPIFLSLALRLRGGKGGFGSQLRAQGGRMSSRRKRGQQNLSSCRDLSGRRLKAVQDAKDLAEYITKQPALEKKARDERRKKLEAVLAQNPLQGIKMDDHAYWEDKERLVDNVKNAVREAVESVRLGGEGGTVEVLHTVSVRSRGGNREIKFSGFDEEYEDSSEEDEDDEEDGDEDAEEEELEEESEEDDYEGSTEEESPAVEGKGKEVEK